MFDEKQRYLEETSGIASQTYKKEYSNVSEKSPASTFKNYSEEIAEAWEIKKKANYEEHYASLKPKSAEVDKHYAKAQHVEKTIIEDTG